MSEPELFVVCKSCGAEVSPYITECPYCGNRLRKRAPKLGSASEPAKPLKPGRGARAQKPPKPPKASRRESGRFDRARIPRTDGRWRPWATILIVLASLLTTLTVRSAIFSSENLLLTNDNFEGEAWRVLTTAFVYGSTAFEAVVLGLIFLFGWLLERRHGHWVPLVVFAVTAAAGHAAAMAAGDPLYIAGGAAPALGLLGAWATRALLDRREADEDRDMLGVLAFAVVLLAMPIAIDDADPVAGVVGGLVGLALGMPLAKMRER